MKTYAPAEPEEPESDHHCCLGWEIVCPDGRVRSYPFHNEDDATGMALYKEQHRCRCWPEASRLELSLPPCPEGRHRVRPIVFDHEV